jgi:serine/threonine protein kinase
MNWWWNKKIQEPISSPLKRTASKKVHKTIQNAETIGAQDEPERYVIYTDKILGQGAFGAVFKGYDTKTKTDVVIKKFKSNSVLGFSPEESYMREVGCLSYVREYCIELGLICYIDHFEYETKTDDNLPITEYYIVSNLLDGYITLDDLLEEDEYILTQEMANKIKNKIDTSVNELHKKGIRHGDLHQGNIMVDPRTLDQEDVQIRLIDFGLCFFPEKGTGIFSKIKDYFKFFMIIIEKQSLDNLFFVIDRKVNKKQNLKQEQEEYQEQEQEEDQSGSRKSKSPSRRSKSPSRKSKSPSRRSKSPSK